ncbi:hypothetical protein GLV94_03015 [Virgibacillus halodenitrificans]|uniref:hypothetical protein n=1 Tax=Virgibacillus halodenitrificans TaxID=1482 RepID=UPI00136F7681|nr:hypothetical protein [Virgibacillus halodenitrificans]MYL44604.1 hypothetical protein [Virgibacillus halodenitrificans]
MFEIILQHKKANGDHQGNLIKISTIPSKGDYVQFSDKAFIVNRVYHIPKEIEGEENTNKVDVILFGAYVDDLSVSEF